MTKEESLQRVINTGIVAVVRAENAEQAIRITEACRAGGIDIIEITMTVPGALAAIQELANTYRQGEIVLGAGTVLDSETARVCLLAGAEFIVSPSFNPEVVRLANRYRKLVMPGAQTITEMVTVMESGADVVKLFPGNAYGPAYVKAVKGPLPQVQIIPTGGVSLDNVGEWIKNGCLAVGVGSELTAGAKTGNYDLITSTARQFVEAISSARKRV
ncbi:bifunctional 2-keto-4-hydroxyglutarate aldolase/2-keto-3-deoxy-6-phosphogluconate aldolase [Desulfosporosinus sp. FKB]|uniref:bifunctional 2-keto-4-hydroxyglutarate aldolase/2-keto-3-deoxy-6-phosphogluconate aldolase n=1 Tax=Desulfosporosinus sp. FKB TaxID=1969835 RepID=UPI000B4A2327|nr:bifunctional 2-keto-4-hydroxyglutarate aldolase/2-keto-3-deoxy-6-phosphogluconate aldolase [Desulfosporosinus sp. FKB]